MELKSDIRRRKFAFVVKSFSHPAICGIIRMWKGSIKETFNPALDVVAPKIQEAKWRSFISRRKV